MADLNYLPNISCPHCGHKTVVSISGFGGELSIRAKECRKCNKEFYVHILAETSTQEEISDSLILSYRERIKCLKEQRKITISELLIRHDEAKKLYDSALVKTKEMRTKYESN